MGATSTVAGVDLEDRRGDFADGWTSEDIDHVLADLQHRLGLQMRAIWEYEDCWGTGGHSDLVVLAGDGTFRQLPAGLWDLLVEGQGDSVIGPSTVPATPHPDWNAGDFAEHFGQLNLVAEHR